MDLASPDPTIDNLGSCHDPTFIGISLINGLMEVNRRSIVHHTTNRVSLPPQILAIIQHKPFVSSLLDARLTRWRILSHTVSTRRLPQIIWSDLIVDLDFLEHILRLDLLSPSLLVAYHALELSVLASLQSLEDFIHLILLYMAMVGVGCLGMDGAVLVVG